MNLYHKLTKDWYYEKENIQRKKVEVIDKAPLILNQKSEYFQTIISDFREQWKENEHLFQYSDILNRYYHVPDALTFQIQSTSNLLIGNGLQTALDFHLTVHPVYGVPYIPGTALKGIASHYFLQTHIAYKEQKEKKRQETVNLEDDKQWDDMFTYIFGTRDSEIEAQRGFITFHDAFPVGSIKLDINEHLSKYSLQDILVPDIMTPHHQQYNQSSIANDTTDSKIAAPRDDDSPIPIPMISVQATFRVMLSCENKDERGKELLELAVSLLQNAIKSEGIGGEMNTGYGRFKVGRKL